MHKCAALVGLAALLVFLPSGCQTAQTGMSPEGTSWIERFAFIAPPVSEEGTVSRSEAKLPEFRVVFSETGPQVARVSLPFAPGVYPYGKGLMAEWEGGHVHADVRVLTLYPGSPRYVRRAMITFVMPGQGECQNVSLKLDGALESVEPMRYEGPLRAHLGKLKLYCDESVLRVRDGDMQWSASVAGPEREWKTPPVTEIIEKGRYFLWARIFLPDKTWPRIVEVRAHALGGVAVRVHVQKQSDGDGYAPDLGWNIHLPGAAQLIENPHWKEESGEAGSFAQGKDWWVKGEAFRLTFPDAHFWKRGNINVAVTTEGSDIIYWRCHAADNVPHQEAAWRTAAFAVTPYSGTLWSPMLEPVQMVFLSPEVYDPLYHSGSRPNLDLYPDVRDTMNVHDTAMSKPPLMGDDFGNVTTLPGGGAFGMNRLNHCPAFLREYYRSGNAGLRETALWWCDNFYNLSVWWGEHREGEFGGTRYNNVSASEKKHTEDTTFMWRSNSAVHFCTKGYDTFFQAYEETGDPRMAVALHWQVAYAKQMIHADQGECRNIGDVADFVRLYEYTGQRQYLEEALRLFRELRTKLSAGDLFSQGGGVIESDPPFIDEDERGYKHPFAKPYIIGYALQGLPWLARYAPEEPKLRDVIRAVADFLAASQDPVGGWRYPHPCSSRLLLDQAMEHAMQLSRAAEFLESRGEPIDNLLDAIERVLRQRVLSCMKNGFAASLLDGLNGWEHSGDLLKNGKNIYDLYKKPTDRDPQRDYTEGVIGVGNASPEGVVYFSEVLDFYLKHRDADRLLRATPELQQVLDRMPVRQGASGEAEEESGYLHYGMENKLPSFAASQIARLKFPMAYDPAHDLDFNAWRMRAREKLLECLLTPPPAAEFKPEIIAREDRGAYEARKLVLNISADCRIPAYLLVPKGVGPFPAIVALHDHGAHFSIGKEKVVRPFGVENKILEDARKWVEQCYGGRFIGDELAKRGYVVFAIDALFWGERGRREGVEYEAQQELAANLLQLGMTWCGVITWDDIRSTDFVASLPEVDPKRIGALGLSMGAHRTWMLCAATDKVATGAAICWMGTTETLMTPGNNQTKGQSAFSMIVPGLRNFLDYPDVAAIACPKPMLFLNGEQDGLFPVEGVKSAYARMGRVWQSQDVAEQLVTELWPVPHVFNQEMQEKTFAWLDKQLHKGE